jgi:DNA repair exonuclease SbcCD ATPase subunit
MNTTAFSDEIRRLQHRKRVARYRTEEIRQREREYSRKYRMELKKKMLKLETRVELLNQQLREANNRCKQLEEENRYLKQKLNETNVPQNLQSSLFQNDLETLAIVATSIQEQIWESEIDRLLSSSKLHRMIRFDLRKFRNLLNEITPHLESLTIDGGPRRY